MMTRHEHEAALLAAVDDMTAYEVKSPKKGLSTVTVRINGSEGELLGNFSAPVAAVREFSQMAYRGVREGNKMIDEVEQIIKALESGDLSLLPEGVEIETDGVYANDNYVA